MTNEELAIWRQTADTLTATQRTLEALVLRVEKIDARLENAIEDARERSPLMERFFKLEADFASYRAETERRAVANRWLIGLLVPAVSTIISVAITMALKGQ